MKPITKDKETKNQVEQQSFEAELRVKNKYFIKKNNNNNCEDL